MNKYLHNCLKMYTSSIDKNLSVSSYKLKEHYATLFLDSLPEDFHSFECLDKKTIYDYLSTLNYSEATITTIKFVLKDLFNYLYTNELSSISGNHLFPIIRTHQRLEFLSHYSVDEINSILDTISSCDKNFRRDRCMLMLATVLGLRTSDILSLKLSDIHWEKSVIVKQQIKTKNTVILPMTKKVKLSIIDYLKNERPITDKDLLFVRKNTDGQYSNGIIYGIIQKYLKRTEICINNRKKGPHVLRHSMATNLLMQNTPLPVITGILGHKNTNTTRRYLSIDIPKLREMSLEVDQYE